PHALVHLISVIGEAANRVSVETRSECDGIPWPDIVGMRNRLIHAYFDINLDILWATVQDSLPSLIRSLESFLPGEKS
ncbi:MAG TPA: HepT-like ribonuclease domain-containing protein, partial [Thermoanaerobaculia bacterium]|nr:HepT-like ribonuclease domain-containing protein [Thermoanaerobaculia bacterium]